MGTQPDESFECSDTKLNINCSAPPLSPEGTRKEFPLRSPRKSVILSPKVEKKSLPSLSKEESQAIWYDNTELNQIQRENGYTVFMLEKGRTINEKRYCPRGLEGETETGKAHSSAAVQAAQAAVFDLQASQRSLGVDNSELIAATYRERSSKSIQEAHQHAIADEKEALDGQHI